MANASQAGLLPLLRGRLTGILNDCKTNDADPWYLEVASEQKSEDFDDTSAVGVEPDDERGGLMNQYEDFRSSTTELPQKSAVLSYFLPAGHDNKNDSGAFAVLKLHDARNGHDRVVAASDGTKELIFDLPDVHNAMKNFRKAAKQAVSLYRSSLPGAHVVEAATDENQEVLLPRLISDLQRPLTSAARSVGNAPELNKKLEALEGMLATLGAALFPEALLHSLKDVEHLYIVPDGRLFLLPLHALPVSSGGATLLDLNLTVSYKPRADYKPAFLDGSLLREHFICANIEDEDFNWSDGFKAWTKSLGSRNVWAVQMCADDRLRKVSEAGRSVFLAHGHAQPGQELFSRIALKDGQCITAHDVNLSRHDYRRAQIFLFSCHSMPQRASTTRELLGLGGTFLSQGVACVAASIWQCEVNDAVVLAEAICATQPQLQSIPQTWCETLRSLGSRCSSPLEKFARVGCFMLYTGD